MRFMVRTIAQSAGPALRASLLDSRAPMSGRFGMNLLFVDRVAVIYACLFVDGDSSLPVIVGKDSQ